MKALWRCPSCGRVFANRRQTHTCRSLDSVDAHFVNRPAAIRELFDALRAAVEACGPVLVLPEKTRIAFQARMSFAQATPRQRWLDGHLVLARRIEHPRFRRIDSLSARNHVHHFRLHDVSSIDAEFRRWLAEAYAVGEQKHLRRAE